MIVIDTHVLVWWASGSFDKLSKRARNSLTQAEKTDGGIIVSAISAWEIAVLVHKSRLTLTMEVEDWLTNVAALPGIQFSSVDRHIAVRSVQLPEPFHKDPADRIIVSTARELNLPLVTSDHHIRAYPHINTVW
ncbi:MAG TPA: type II toxin-antitoxin system VapC family toxin [Trichormus sp.]|jgi:PIN domain nuclease of toxin-antitoxin system